MILSLLEGAGFSPSNLKKLNKAFLEYFKERKYYSTVKDINQGFCMNWAWIVYKLFGGELWINEDFYHAFVKIGNKFYDAQTVNGVSEWIDIGGLRKQRKGMQALIDHGQANVHRSNEREFTFYFHLNDLKTQEETKTVLDIYSGLTGGAK